MTASVRLMYPTVLLHISILMFNRYLKLNILETELLILQISDRSPAHTENSSHLSLHHSRCQLHSSTLHGPKEITTDILLYPTYNPLINPTGPIFKMYSD